MIKSEDVKTTLSPEALQEYLADTGQTLEELNERLDGYERDQEAMEGLPVPDPETVSDKFKEPLAFDIEGGAD